MPINGLLNIGIQINESNISSDDCEQAYVVTPEMKSFTSQGIEVNGIESIIRNDRPTNNSKKEHFLDVADERYRSLPNRQKHEAFLTNFVKEVLDNAVFNATVRENKVNEWRSPEQLTQILDLQLKNKPDSDAKLMQLVQDVIKYSVKTGHPYFVNQLFSGVDPYALAGQWLTDALNPSVSIRSTFNRYESEAQN
jgi:Pyridoxal-dependent decarboxylase conserved domain